MSGRRNYRYIGAADPAAEPVCRLTSEWASTRNEPPEKFFADATAQTLLPHGYELRFPGGESIRDRIEAFVAEESTCCPFFAFETWESQGENVIRILRPDVADERHPQGERD